VHKTAIKVKGTMSRRVILIFACLVAMAALCLFIYLPKIAPWVNVIGNVNTSLEDNPKFENHLDNYAQIGSSGGSLLTVVGAVDPVLGIMDDVDALLESPAIAVFDLAGIPVRAVKELISTINDGLQELGNAKRELDELSDLQAVANATRSYRDHPNEESLRHLIEACAASENALGSAQEKLAWLPPRVDALNDAMHDVTSTLEEITDRSILGLSDIAERIDRFLQPVADRLDSFAILLHRYQSEMNRDISTIKTIGGVATRVGEINDHGDIWFKIALKIVALLP
jgi:hypothetical protein